jgi:hypothetical protein
MNQNLGVHTLGRVSLWRGYRDRRRELADQLEAASSAGGRDSLATLELARQLHELDREWAEADRRSDRFLF